MINQENAPYIIIVTEKDLLKIYFETEKKQEYLDLWIVLLVPALSATTIRSKIMKPWIPSTSSVYYNTKIILKVSALLLYGAILIGCSHKGTHQQYLQTELAKVSYDNGISVTEAKIIGDAYVYLYARDGNKIPHVRVRSGKNDKQSKWLGDIYSGVAISPIAATLDPLEIDKLNGKVTWAHGPTIMKVELHP